MQKDIFKKIITILYLTIFLFGLFMPFNIIFAEDPTETNPLIISTAKNILLPSEPTEITAKLYSVGGETVSFSAFYTNGSDLTEFPDFQTLSQRTCTPLGNTHSNIVSCSVTFSSAREKTYIIKASIIRNGQTFSSPNITILIAKPITDNQQSSADTDTTYTPLAPLPGLPAVPYETDTECPFGNYLNIIIKLIIGIAAVLAMVMIVMGGIEYLTSDLVSSKEAGKDTIRNAILGLLIALGAYLILNTINPQLLSVCLDKLPQATITISPDDTSTGSSTSLCISTTNPPNPDSAKGTSMKSVMSKPAMPEYEKVINTINSISKGKKYLATAQAGVEGFYPGSKSYKTNNPGNIGNTDDGKTRSFPTLKEGIVAQTEKVVSGQGSYKIGSKPTCALGNEVYDGSLYQYLRIYATGARVNNNYVNAIIGYFSDNGKNITARTKMSDIYNMQ